MARQIDDLRAQKRDKAAERKGAASVAPIISSFEFNGVKYRKTDWDNEFTVRQDMIAMDLVKEIYSNFFTSYDENTVKLQEEMTKAKGASKEEMMNDSKLQSLAVQEAIKTLNSDNMNRWEPRIIALFYIPETEKLFNIDTFAAREIEFMDLPRSTRAKLKGLLDDFFYIKVPSIAADFLSSMGAMRMTMGQK